MEQAKVGQRVKYISPEDGSIYFGTVKSTQVIDCDYLPNYQRAFVDIDSYVSDSYVFTQIECAVKFLDCC